MRLIKMSGARFVNGLTEYAAKPQRTVRTFTVGRLAICWFGRKNSAGGA